MHALIGAIVYARSKKEALVKAKSVFRQLCGEGKAFDYFVTFDEDSPLAGRNRWGNYSVVAKADSQEGQDLINKLMGATRQGFMENMERIRKALEVLSDEELFTEELSDQTKVLMALGGRAWRFEYSPSMVKADMRSAGSHRGPGIHLYDQSGEGIRTPRHLSNVLTKWDELYKGRQEENPYAKLEVYVVPADVHF